MNTVHLSRVCGPLTQIDKQIKIYMYIFFLYYYFFVIYIYVYFFTTTALLWNSCIFSQDFVEGESLCSQSSHWKPVSFSFRSLKN